MFKATVLIKRRPSILDPQGVAVEKGAKYVIAVGGDGTLNEVARAIMNNRNVISGIIPASPGSGTSDAWLRCCGEAWVQPARGW